jgi:hypothetical protein
VRHQAVKEILEFYLVMTQLVSAIMRRIDVARLLSGDYGRQGEAGREDGE